jgi:hypothetical protein
VPTAEFQIDDDAKGCSQRSRHGAAAAAADAADATDPRNSSEFERARAITVTRRLDWIEERLGGARASSTSRRRRWCAC